MSQRNNLLFNQSNIVIDWLNQVGGLEVQEPLNAPLYQIFNMGIEYAKNIVATKLTHGADNYAAIQKTKQLYVTKLNTAASRVTKAERSSAQARVNPKVESNEFNEKSVALIFQAIKKAETQNNLLIKELQFAIDYVRRNHAGEEAAQQWERDVSSLMNSHTQILSDLTQQVVLNMPIVKSLSNTAGAITSNDNAVSLLMTRKGAVEVLKAFGKDHANFIKDLFDKIVESAQSSLSLFANRPFMDDGYNARFDAMLEGHAMGAVHVAHDLIEFLRDFTHFIPQNAFNLTWPALNQKSLKAWKDATGDESKDIPGIFEKMIIYTNSELAHKSEQRSLFEKSLSRAARFDLVNLSMASGVFDSANELCEELSKADTKYPGISNRAFMRIRDSIGMILPYIPNTKFAKFDEANIDKNFEYKDVTVTGLVTNALKSQMEYIDTQKKCIQEMALIAFSEMNKLPYVDIIARNPFFQSFGYMIIKMIEHDQTQQNLSRNPGTMSEKLTQSINEFRGVMTNYKEELKAALKPRHMISELMTWAAESCQTTITKVNTIISGLQDSGNWNKQQVSDILNSILQNGLLGDMQFVFETNKTLTSIKSNLNNVASVLNNENVKILTELRSKVETDTLEHNKFVLNIIYKLYENQKELFTTFLMGLFNVMLKEMESNDTITRFAAFQAMRFWTQGVVDSANLANAGQAPGAVKPPSVQSRASQFATMVTRRVEYDENLREKDRSGIGPMVKDLEKLASIARRKYENVQWENQSIRSIVTNLAELQKQNGHDDAMHEQMIAMIVSSLNVVLPVSVPPVVDINQWSVQSVHTMIKQIGNNQVNPQMIAIPRYSEADEKNSSNGNNNSGADTKKLLNGIIYHLLRSCERALHLINESQIASQIFTVWSTEMNVRLQQKVGQNQQHQSQVVSPQRPNPTTIQQTWDAYNKLLVFISEQKNLLIEKGSEMSTAFEQMNKFTTVMRGSENIMDRAHYLQRDLLTIVTSASRSITNSYQAAQSKNPASNLSVLIGSTEGQKMIMSIYSDVLFKAQKSLSEISVSTGHEEKINSESLYKSIQSAAISLKNFIDNGITTAPRYLQQLIHTLKTNVSVTRTDTDTKECKDIWDALLLFGNDDFQGMTRYQQASEKAEEVASNIVRKFNDITREIEKKEYLLQMNESTIKDLQGGARNSRPLSRLPATSAQSGTTSSATKAATVVQYEPVAVRGMRVFDSFVKMFLENQKRTMDVVVGDYFWYSFGVLVAGYMGCDISKVMSDTAFTIIGLVSSIDRENPNGNSGGGPPPEMPRSRGADGGGSNDGRMSGMGGSTIKKRKYETPLTRPSDSRRKSKGKSHASSAATGSSDSRKKPQGRSNAPSAASQSAARVMSHKVTHAPSAASHIPKPKDKEKQSSHSADLDTHGPQGHVTAQSTNSPQSFEISASNVPHFNSTSFQKSLKNLPKSEIQTDDPITEEIRENIRSVFKEHTIPPIVLTETDQEAQTAEIDTLHSMDKNKYTDTNNDDDKHNSSNEDGDQDEPTFELDAGTQSNGSYRTDEFQSILNPNTYSDVNPSVPAQKSRNNLPSLNLSDIPGNEKDSVTPVAQTATSRSFNKVEYSKMANNLQKNAMNALSLNPMKSDEEDSPESDESDENDDNITFKSGDSDAESFRDEGPQNDSEDDVGGNTARAESPTQSTTQAQPNGKSFPSRTTGAPAQGASAVAPPDPLQMQINTIGKFGYDKRLFDLIKRNMLPLAKGSDGSPLFSSTLNDDKEIEKYFTDSLEGLIRQTLRVFSYVSGYGGEIVNEKVYLMFQPAVVSAMKTSLQILRTSKSTSLYRECGAVDFLTSKTLSTPFALVVARRALYALRSSAGASEPSIPSIQLIKDIGSAMNLMCNKIQRRKGTLTYLEYVEINNANIPDRTKSTGKVGDENYEIFDYDAFPDPFELRL